MERKRMHQEEGKTNSKSNLGMLRKRRGGIGLVVCCTSTIDNLVIVIVGDWDEALSSPLCEERKKKMG